MTENEINVTATCIATLANQTNSIEKIKILLTSLLGSNKKADFSVEKKHRIVGVFNTYIHTKGDKSNA